MDVRPKVSRSVDDGGSSAVVESRQRLRRDAMPHERARTWRWIGVGALLSVLMRVRMLWSPISVDEGGYLAIARAWAHGRVLYRDVWVDRPQGLLVLFRLWDWLSGGSTPSIRMMAMLFGAVLVVATSVIVWELVGPAAARWTGVTCGVVSAAPVLEAHTANGELLSGAISAAALAVAVVGPSRTRSLLWFCASGLLAGIALSLKQSGFDGLLTIVCWLAISALVSPGQRRAALRRLTMVFAGLASVLSMLVVHGALTGWSRWWTAVAGYRLRVESWFAGAEWTNLRESSRFAFAVLGVTALAAMVGVALLVDEALRGSRRYPRRRLILVLWLLISIGSFLIGGGFWRHYWQILAAPLSALAGVALARMGKLAFIATAAMVAPCLAVSMWVFTADPNQINVRASSDSRSSLDTHVARWFGSHRRDGDNLYVMCFSAALYADAHQDPGYPYLWFTEVQHGPKAHVMLVAYLADPRRAPRFIAKYQSTLTCDPSGDVERIVSRDYHGITSVDGVGIYQRNVVPDAAHAVPHACQLARARR